MTKKRFTNIEHDYENAWIKCNDNGYFMIYAIYKELDEGLPSLEDLLNGLSEENDRLKNSVKRQEKSNEKCSKYIEEIAKENEELKVTIGEMEDYLARMEEKNKELKEKLDDILKLTELTGMIHLRKAEIKSIIIDEKNNDGDL